MGRPVSCVLFAVLISGCSIIGFGEPEEVLLVSTDKLHVTCKGRTLTIKYPQAVCKEGEKLETKTETVEFDIVGVTQEPASNSPGLSLRIPFSLFGIQW